MSISMMKDNKTKVSELKEMLSNFVKERDWEKFHSPKNLSMSIAIEAAELMEKFQWLSPEDSLGICGSEADGNEIESEIADIATFVLDFCNVAKIDLSSAIEKKLHESGRKYPVDKVKGKSHKYTYYERDRK